jgi:restriction system protein
LEGNKKEGIFLLIPRSGIQSAEKHKEVHMSKLSEIAQEMHELGERIEKDNKEIQELLDRACANRKRTPNEKYKIPLLETLVEAGGSLKPQDVGDRVKIKLRDVLTDHDRTMDPSGTRQRWDDGMRYARLELVIDGLMEGTEHGIWTISKKGIELISKIRAIKSC